MKKYLILLATAALFFALLAGCNSESNNPPPVETTTSAPKAQLLESVTAAPAAASEVRITVEEKTVQPLTKAVEQPKEEKTVNNITSEKATQALKTTEKQSVPDVKITKEEAKKAVLAHAGLTETDVKFYKVELDRERGSLVYEIEFVSGKYEYDYEVDAESGNIIKSEKEFND